MGKNVLADDNCPNSLFCTTKKRRVRYNAYDFPFRVSHSLALIAPDNFNTLITLACHLCALVYLVGFVDQQMSAV